MPGNPIKDYKSINVLHRRRPFYMVHPQKQDLSLGFKMASVEINIRAWTSPFTSHIMNNLLLS